MLKRHKDLLRAIVGEMRRTLAGSMSTAGEAQRGDLDRELERIGIATDASITPLDALPNPAPNERRAHSVAVAQLSPLPPKDRPAARAEIVERAAYSWINRLLALRAMEARGLIDETLRNNPDYDGLSEALFVLRQSEPQRTAGADAGWWAVIEDACSAQAASLPGLFSLDDPNVALRPSTPALLRCVAVVGSAPSGFTLEEADAAFADPDAIGWAYQFYQEQAKALVYAKLGSGGKVSTRAEIAAATQLFTEPYMVKWLLQNSLGRSYHELFPGTKLTASWEYYITPDKLEPPAYMGLVSLTVMDPCMGSGHFLREAFDMFAAMYREQHPDMPAAQIADNILQKHLHGIDIDPRAAQLAALTLYLRAWETVRDERRAQRRPGPATYAPPPMNLATTPTNLDAGSLERHLQRHPEDRVLKPLLEGIFQALEQADILGSLLRPGEHLDAAIAALQKPHQTRMDFDSDDSDLRQTMTELAQRDPAELKRMLLDRVAHSFAAEGSSTNDVAAALFGHEAEQGVRLLQLLDQRYGVVVTNPPYMGSSSMITPVKTFIQRHYAAGKTDLYAAFIIRCLKLAHSRGRIGMITQHGWLALQSFADLRATSEEQARYNEAADHFKGVLIEATIEVLAHLGANAFEEIGGEVVQTVMFTAGKHRPGSEHELLAFRLVGIRETQAKALGLRKHANRSAVKQVVLTQLPDAPIIYRWPENISSAFLRMPSLSSIARVYDGLTSGDTSRAIRFQWEVLGDSKRWVLHQKGGSYARWWGLHHYRLDWRAGARALYSEMGGFIRNDVLYGTPGLIYSRMARGSLGVRVANMSVTFDTAARFVLPRTRESSSYSVLAYLNTRPVSYVLRLLVQSMDFTGGYVERVPWPGTLPDFLAEAALVCVEMKKHLVSGQLLEVDYDYASKHQSENVVSAHLATLEGFIEDEVARALGLDEEAKTAVYNETGIPTGLAPLLDNYDQLPPFPSELSAPKVLLQAYQTLPARARREHGSQEDAQVKETLRRLYQAGPGGISVEQEPEEADPDAESAEVSSPVPTETFLEELSQKLQIHPISVYWLLEELRAEGVRCKPEEQRLLEDRLSVMVLRLLGHRWPKQIEEGEAVPEWADADGIIPLTPGLGAEEQTLADRLRARLRAEDGEVGAQQAEALLLELTGMSLEEWLRKRFFTRHVRQFKYRPIAWHLASSPMQGGSGKKKGGGRRAPAFECMLYYHASESDVLARIRTRYVEPMLRAERRRAEEARKANDETTAAIATDRIHELEEFSNRLRGVEEAGFACDELDKLLANEQLDRWSGDGYLPPASMDELAHNERAWRVDINDGVRVNIAPLQMAGVLAGDVLKALDARKAVADRARWRSDERRWVREGKLPRPGWMGEDVSESHAWTALAPQREAERLKLEQKRKAVMEKLGPADE